MIRTASSTNPTGLAHDRRSAIAVCVVTLASLILGALLRNSVENRSQQINQKGISASVPANWVVQDGAGDLIVVAWDPFAPDVRYSIYLVLNQGTASLQEISSDRNTALGKALEGFRILEETPVIRRGREGYKVTYAFIDSDQPGLPVIIQGVDYYFSAEVDTLIVSLQSHDEDFEEALMHFEPFLDSVTYE